MINPECSICNIINQPDNDDVTLFDNETVGAGWRIALMNDQGAIGASYLTTREHRSDIDELTDSEWVELRDLVRLLAGALRREFSPVHLNFACDMNDLALDGTPTHVHFKLRPRGFVPVEIGQERFSDAGFGTKIIFPHKVERSTLELIQERLERDR